MADSTTVFTSEEISVVKAKIAANQQYTGVQNSDSLAIANQMALVNGTTFPLEINPVVIMLAGDHKIHQQFKNEYPYQATAHWASLYMANKGLHYTYLSTHDLPSFLVDASIDRYWPPEPGMVHAKMARGANNFLQDSAIDYEKLLPTIQKGKLLVNELIGNEYLVVLSDISATGSVANLCLASTLLHIPLSDIHNRIQGQKLLDPELNKLDECVRHITAMKPNEMELLQYFGGYETAMIAGMILQLAERKKIILLEGMSALLALTIISKAYPQVIPFCIAGGVVKDSLEDLLASALGLQTIGQHIGIKIPGPFACADAISQLKTISLSLVNFNISELSS